MSGISSETTNPPEHLNIPLPTAHLTPPKPGSATPPVILLLIGSFSPITHMHLRLLELARDHLQANGRHVIGGYISLAGDAYHKPHLQPAMHRLAMTRLALDDAGWVAVDEWEMRHERYVRTFEVVARLREEVGRLGWRDAETFLVCGADLVEAMGDEGRWPRESVDRLFKVARVLWVRRGMVGGKIFADGGTLERYAGRAEEVQGFCWGLSSTIVRKCVREGRSILYMTPTPVIEYIQKHGLFLEE